MHKIYITFLLLLIHFCVCAQCPICPPNVEVMDDKFCSFTVLTVTGGSTLGVQYSHPDSLRMTACKGSIKTYCFTPSPFFDAGSGTLCTYDLPTIDSTSIIGGTVLSVNNNCVTVQWSSSNNFGTLSAYWGEITNSASSLPGGVNCRSFGTIHIELTNPSVANFTATPQPACFSNPTNITFNASASTSANVFLWNFGDGGVGSGAITSHNYNAPGTYNVCLTVWQDSSAPHGGLAGSPDIPCYACIDSMCSTITIDALPPPPIFCVASICDGDTAQFCTDNTCTSFNWSVVGGTIISGAGTACILVKWGSGVPQGTVSVTTAGCATNYCNIGNSVTQPIVGNNLSMTGNDTVCVNSIEGYFIPTLPGTNYTWSISGGGNIVGNTNDVSNIGVNWTSAGTHTVNVNYYNEALDCGGATQMVVHVLPNLQITGTSSTCANTVGSYNASDPATNSPINCIWTVSSGATISSGQGTNAISVSFGAGGTYTITADGLVPNITCEKKQFIVNVFPEPVVTAITGPLEICPGGITDHGAITNPSSGIFFWSGTGYNSLLPNPGPGDSVNVTWGATGPYSLSVQLLDNNGCLSSPYSANYNAVGPATVTGTFNVCADDTAVYTVTYPTNGAFNWFVTPAQYANIIQGQGTNQATIVWNGSNNPGNSITVWLHFGTCGTDSVAVIITDPAPITITQAGSLCNGGITLSTVAGSTYNWGCLEHPISPAQSNTNSTLTGLDLGGTYTVSVTNVNGGGCKANASLFIPNTGRPIAMISSPGPILYCFPNLPNTTLNALTGIGYTYEWFFSGTSVGVGPSLTVNNGPPCNINAVGVYTFYLVTTLNNCKDTSLPYVIYVTTCDSASGCVATLVVDSIKGCNPKQVFSTVSGPPGSTQIPNSQTIKHLSLPGLPTVNDTFTLPYPTAGFKPIRVCKSLLLPDNSVCGACKDTSILITVGASFQANENCGIVNFINSSTVQSPATITSYNWTVGNYPTNSAVPPAIASINNPSSATPTLNISIKDTFIVTLTVTASDGCIATYIDTVISNKADASFTHNSPCVGSSTSFVANSNAPTQYWNFGDGAASYVNPTLHAYAAANNYVVMHAVINANGCKDTVYSNITIQNKPTCNLTPLGSLVLCGGDTGVVNACSGYINYQWYRNGVAISGATGSSYSVTTNGNYHVTANTIGTNCFVISDTLTYIVNPTPIAKVDSSASLCVGDIVKFTTPPCSTCVYSWFIDNTLVGNANNYNAFPGVVPLTVGTHTILVQVSNAFGCVDIDSAIMTVSSPPVVNIVVAGAASPPYCEGTNYTLTATTNASNPQYQWANNGLNISSSASLTTNAAGIFSLVVKDLTTGCKATDAEIIFTGPDLSLFPIGCDQLCDSETVAIPLPNIGGNLSGYTINWYDNAPPYISVGTGPTLPAYTFSPIGNTHYVSVIVTAPNGCADTSTVFQFLHGVNCSSTYGVPLSLSNITLHGVSGWNKNVLTFISSDVINTEHIALIRSTDGINFEQVELWPQHKLASDGQLNIYEDNDLQATAQHYKLIQTLINGSKLFSNTVVLKNSSAQDVSIFPTRSNGNFNIEINSLNSGKYNLIVSSGDGRIVHQSNVHCKAGNNAVELKLPNLVDGMYFIELRGTNSKHVQKVIVQH